MSSLLPIDHAVVTTTIRLRFDGHSTAVRLRSLRLHNDVAHQCPLTRQPQWRRPIYLFIYLSRSQCPGSQGMSSNGRSAVELQSNRSRIEVKS